jgi:predicted enzyme related to lactoylglutathione lyase
MSHHEKLDYVEFAAKDLVATRHFFEQVFQWEFTEYGEEYMSFANQGINGGFYHGQFSTKSGLGGALLIFYSHDLQGTLEKIQENSGKITKSIFTFPGGRRFHFEEPSGNEFAVWSDIEPKKRP